MIASYYSTWEKINPGDLIVEAGVRNLLAHFPTPPDPAPLFLVGEPWFWDQCDKSPKYRWLAELLAEHHGKRALVAIGAGMNVPLGHTHKLLNGPTRDRCRDLWSRFDLVIVRDWEASKFLQSIGVAHWLLPCPSIFAWQEEISPRLHSTLVVDAPCWNETLSPAELPPIPGARYSYESGIYRPEDVQALLRFFASHEAIVSARVHAALPMVAFRRVATVAMDSRVQTALMAGIPEFPAFSDPAAGAELRARSHEQYVTLLSPIMPQIPAD